MGRGGGVFKATDLYEDLECKNLGLPEPITEGNSHWEEDLEPSPFVLVRDSAFSSTEYMMNNMCWNH